MAFRIATSLDQLRDGTMTTVVVDGRRVLLIRTGGHVSAFEDRCMHQSAYISIGKLAGRSLTCKLHGWRYDAVTGTGEQPCTTQLARFAVKLEGEAVWLDVDQVITRARGPYDDG
jgi:toluene monooxygenase system ferredoxin subunit